MRWRSGPSLVLVLLGLAAGTLVGHRQKDAFLDAGHTVLPPGLEPPPFRLPGGARLAGVPYAPENARLDPHSAAFIAWAVAVEGTRGETDIAVALRAQAYLAAARGNYRDALRILDRAFDLASKDSTISIDRAAIELALAKEERDTWWLAQSLEDASRALLQHRSAESLATLASIVEELGLAESARRGWREYLRIETLPAARQEASLRIERLERPQQANAVRRRKSLLDRFASTSSVDKAADAALLRDALALANELGDPFYESIARCLGLRSEACRSARSFAARSNAAANRGAFSRAAELAGQAGERARRAGAEQLALHWEQRRLLNIFRAGPPAVQLEKEISSLPVLEERSAYLEGWRLSFQGWFAALKADLAKVEVLYLRAADRFAEAQAFDDQAWMLGSVGWSRSQIGQNAAAWDAAIQAFRSASRAADRAQETNAGELAAEILTRSGFRSAAAWFLSERLRYLRETSGNALMEADVQSQLADAYRRSGDDVRAQQAIKAGVSAALRMQDEAARRTWLDTFAWTLSRLPSTSPQRAEAILNRLLTSFGASEWPFLEAALLEARGRARLRLGRDAEALDDLRRGSVVFDQQRDRLAEGADAAPYFAQAQSVVNAWVYSLANFGRWTEAVQVGDIARSRGLPGQPAMAVALDQALPELSKPALVVQQLEGAVLIAQVRDGLVAGRLLPVPEETTRRCIAAAVALAERNASLEQIRDALGPLVAIEWQGTTPMDLVVVADETFETAPFAALLSRAGGHPRFSVVSSLRSASRIASRTRQSDPPKPLVVLVAPEAFAPAGQFPLGVRKPLLESDVRITVASPSLTYGEIASLFSIADVIVISSHGETSGSSGGNTGIYLGQRGEEQRWLTAAEIRRFDLGRAPLVLLGACFSASGRKIALDGQSSPARAFLDAGAKTVVAALGRVSDKEVNRYQLELLRIVRHQPAAPVDIGGNYLLQAYGMW
jgi:hypothetical protein